MIRKYLISLIPREKIVNIEHVTSIAKLLDDNNCSYNGEEREEREETRRNSCRKSDVTMQCRKFKDWPKFLRTNPTCQTTALCNLNETPTRVFALLNYNPMFIFVYIIMKWCHGSLVCFIYSPRYITRQLSKHRDPYLCFTKCCTNVFDIFNYRSSVRFTSVFTVFIRLLLHACITVLSSDEMFNPLYHHTRE